MNTRLVIGLSLGLAVLLFAGAIPVAADGGDVGICVVGADSPCNGDEDDHNDSDTNTTGDPSEPIQYADGDLPYASGPTKEPVEPVKEPRGGDVGICVVGADSPCNGEEYDGDREVSDPLPPADDECVPGPATMCAPVDAPTRPADPEPHWRNGSDLPPTAEECVPGPATMCVPEEWRRGPAEEDIRCVRAPCELPENATAPEYCIDSEGVVMDCESFPEDADVEPYEKPDPAVMMPTEPTHEFAGPPTADPAAQSNPIRSSPFAPIRALFTDLFGLFGF